MSEYPSAEKLMAGPLGGWLHAQTAVREDAKKASMDRMWKAALISLPVCAFLLVLGVISFNTLLYLGAIAGAGIWYWTQGPKRDAIKQVKTGINQAIAEALGLQYEHDLEPGTGFELAKSYKLLPAYDRSGFEDLWTGVYAGRAFTLHEAHLEEERGSGKHRNWVTVFRGSIITIEFSRRFHGITLVSRAGRHKKFLGFGGRKDSVKLDGVELDIVDMVHPDFEGAFDVYSNDQVEARYIVHPAYIERLIAIENAFSGEDICSLFYEGQLVVALNCGNLFESGSIDASDDGRRLASTIDQFARLADLAQSLQEPDR